MHVDRLAALAEKVLQVVDAGADGADAFFEHRIEGLVDLGDEDDRDEGRTAAADDVVVEHLAVRLFGGADEAMINGRRL